MKSIVFFKSIVLIFLFSCRNGEDHTGITLKFVNHSDHQVILKAFNYSDEQVGRMVVDTSFNVFEKANEIWGFELDGKVEKLRDYSFLDWLGDSVYIDFDNSKRLIFRARVDESGRSVFNEQNYKKSSSTYKSGITHTLVYTITNEDFENALLIE